MKQQLLAKHDLSSQKLSWLIEFGLTELESYFSLYVVGMGVPSDFYV